MCILLEAVVSQTWYTHPYSERFYINKAEFYMWNAAEQDGWMVVKGEGVDQNGNDCSKTEYTSTGNCGSFLHCKV